jgi:Tfp pilus assembly protein PilF
MPRWSNQRSWNRGETVTEAATLRPRSMYFLLTLLSMAAAPMLSQPGCSALPSVRQAIERGWSAYRANDIAAAGNGFKRALALCPNDPGALTGAGYAAMREGRLPESRAFFARAIAADSSSYDAVAGAGMAAYRSGDPSAARRSFERALRIVPNDSTALAYLARLPGRVAADVLVARSRPAQTTVVARAGRRVLEVRNSAGQWSPMWIKAVNLGAALPGKFPSEFPPDDGTYARWIALIADMGANTVRVYTIHPPHFYSALRDWNLAHPSHPVWLIHGVWAEPPPGVKEEQYDDPQWLAGFRREMQRVVSLVHGDALIPPAPGHASGAYRADVSPWTLSYITGREWEPYSVVQYNALNPRKTRYDGKYIAVRAGNPLETWLAEQCDYMVSFEMERYNAQRPIAYTNWPTLDPLTHPTETSMPEEIALLRARGEQLVEKSKEYDNDAVGLDGLKMRATAAFSAGVFASYHVYPYYPEFLLVDPVYSKARSPEGPSNYYGYLRELIAHHGDMPVVISEYGVPSSRGIGHFQPQGWHHGGHSEQEQALVNARLTRDIYASGAAGAGLFALIDEWFKRSWIVTDFEYPHVRKQLWLNPLDAEEHYGVVAMRAGKKSSRIRIDGDSADWRGRPVLYSAAGARPSVPASLQLKSLRVAHDEAYVYLRLDVGRIDWARARYQIGIDTYRRNLGDTRLPITATRAPVGLEFVLELGGPDQSQLLVDHPYNPYRPVVIPGSKPPATQYVYNPAVRIVANDLGQWDSLIVVPNRRRIGRDGKIYPAISYNRNRLLHARESDNSLADWFADAKTGVVEVRLPWGMLQLVDPSTRSVLIRNTSEGHAGGATTDGFRFIVESYDPSSPRSGGDALPRGASAIKFADVPTWTWTPWEKPEWHAEIKPLFAAMKRAFEGIPDRPTAR